MMSLMMLTTSLKQCMCHRAASARHLSVARTVTAFRTLAPPHPRNLHEPPAPPTRRGLLAQALLRQQGTL